ncbi:hypothetical protein PHYBOEH_008802 [Phytophthora boehmeriae]|uniref:Uncharacterized protein n=1 Tax=Phytophthora boehmeriae TaxID=109152 RepID=A0A8T1W1M5_9STRA|nr:hypothetical protein PHYBOEH_008802 [Phytophthora boehmeriae]
MPPPSSRRSSATGDAPLTAERAMMDQIRSKLERAQRRLARNAPSSSSSSSVGSRYIPSSEYNSAMHKPPVKSVLVEDMPATASKTYSSKAPPPSSIRPPPPSRQGVPPPTTSKRYHTSSSSSSRVQYNPQQQYKSRSKYSQSTAETDPLNGGPPPMSTPYLVYSSPRPPTTGSTHHAKSSRPPMSKAIPPPPPTEQRQRDPTLMNGPPSAMRSGFPKPPSSRVRFQGHEAERRESVEKERASEMERKRRQQQMKEREARHQKQRQKELETVNARAKGAGPSSPIAAGNRGRRSSSMEKPPGSAIDVAAFEEMGPRGRRSNSVEKPPPSAIAIPKSPVGRSRRSSVNNNPPPKSDIKVSAFDDIIPRRRTAAQDNQTVSVKAEKTIEEPKQVKEHVVDLKSPSGETDVEQEQSPEVDNQKEQQSPPPSVVPEPYTSSTSSDDEGDTSGFNSDDSDLQEFSDFDVDSDYDYLSSNYSDYASTARSELAVDSPKAEPVSSNDSSPSDGSTQDPEAEDSPESPPASELSPVEEEPQSRLTARDLAFLALGRVSSCSQSDVSPVTSANGKVSPKYKPAPMSYAPASSAFPPSRSLARTPATTGRPRGVRVPPPAPQTSGANYIRRSRARAPMDLKNQLPPSIGVLSGLSSGSSKFVVDPSCFYEVVWKTGEFAFSVQRVYTEENEFEFDDRNQEPQLFLRMLLNTERSTCKSFHSVRVGDVLIRVGDAYVSELGLEGSGSVLTKFFAKLTAQTPIKLTFQRMYFSEWEGGVEL